MERFIQIAALCVIAALLSTALRKQGAEFSLLLGLGCCAAALIGAKTALEPVLAFLNRLGELAGLRPAVFVPLIKCVGVGLLSQLAGAFCQDAGQQALAKTVELCGSVMALWAALPLASLLLQTLGEMMGA